MNCKKCDKVFEPSKGLVNFCSMQCRQAKAWTQEDKQKKSDALKLKLSDEESRKLLEIYDKTKSLTKTAQILGIHPKTVKKYVVVVKSEKKTNYDHIKAWRQKIKIDLVNYKGGKCVSCDYDKCISALEFHHLDPKEKDFSIGESGKTRAFEKMKEEVDKCVLVCANCHREIHAGLLIIT